MSGFDEWFITRHGAYPINKESEGFANYMYLLKETKKAWNEQQKKIDELTIKLENTQNAVIFADECRKEWAESFRRSKGKIDAVLKLIESSEKYSDRSIHGLQDDIKELLKCGKT